MSFKLYSRKIEASRSTIEGDMLRSTKSSRMVQKHVLALWSGIGDRLTAVRERDGSKGLDVNKLLNSVDRVPFAANTFQPFCSR